MRKIKTKGLKIKVRNVDRGPRYAIVLNITLDKSSPAQALAEIFDCNEALAEDVVKKTPLVICRDLDQSVASNYVKRLKGKGNFQVWLESAAGKLRQMNLKQKNEDPAIPTPHIRKH